MAEEKAIGECQSPIVRKHPAGIRYWPCSARRPPHFLSMLNSRPMVRRTQFWILDYFAKKPALAASVQRPPVPV